MELLHFDQGNSYQSHNLVHREKNLYEKMFVKIIWEISSLKSVFMVGYGFDYMVEKGSKVSKGPEKLAIKWSKF